MTSAAVHHLDDARETLTRLLGELGVRIELAQEIDCASLESIAKGFRSPWHASRLIGLDHASLSDLELPALTVLDGTLAVVRRVGPRMVAVELARGEQCELLHHELLTRAGGVGLEIVLSLPHTGSFVARLIALLGQRTRDLLKLGFLALALALLGLVGPYVTRLVVDRALPERSPKLLVLLACGTLLVSLQRAVFSWLEQRATLALHGRLEAAVSTRLFDHLLRIPYAALVRESVGSWLETLSGARHVQTLLTDKLLMPLLNVLMACVYAIALAREHVAIAVLLFLGALLLSALSFAFALRASRLERQVIEASAQQQAALYEVVKGVLTLRTCGAEQRGVLRWLDRLLGARNITARIDLLGSLSRNVIDGLRQTLTTATFVWAAYACLQHQLTVGALLSILMLGDRFVSVLVGFADVLTPALTARMHLPRIDALLGHEDVTSNESGGKPSFVVAGDAIVLEDVWFRYGPDQPYILQGYSLRVPSLSHFELRGPSGMGKSTILRLIAGLYTPERGSVRVFGHAPRDLRSEICYLPQDAHLFGGTILQNVRLLSDASLEAIQAAAKRTGLADLVATLPMGFETVLPPGATTLSGGQRQLIVWTAAMASGRKLLLLDEALSQVDRLTRARLLALSQEQQRTAISVEHERSLC